MKLKFFILGAVLFSFIACSSANSKTSIENDRAVNQAIQLSELQAETD